MEAVFGRSVEVPAKIVDKERRSVAVDIDFVLGIQMVFGN
jgi:hypothetical protein